MHRLRQHFDAASIAVIVITFALFAMAAFAQGLSHDLFLEAGVLLVSVKLIMVSYKSSLFASEQSAKLEAVREAVARLEQALAKRQASADR